jgi:tetratricopeptide (TPR) repeat protein
MSQLLSEAKRNYDEGVRLMFPQNYDARMIELRIEQQIDLPAFNASFRQRLNEAVAGTRPNVRSLQSFADLQDLAGINPQFSGIQAIIIQAEIDMGLRPPPLVPRDLARSNELTRSAQVNIGSMDATRYEVAQTQLEEAIRLNPNNTQAQSLLDQISLLISGTGRFILPNAVQELYDAAVQLYNQGNYLRANAIMERLLLNADNRKSTLLMELKRRIDAIL